MGVDDLGNLRTDCERRVQRGHRFLEDHRNPVAANLPHGAVVERREVDAMKEDVSAGNLGIDRHQLPELDKAVIDFPQPLSPTTLKISPRPTENDTWSTAAKSRLRPLIDVTRSRISSSGAVFEPDSTGEAET